MTSLQKKCFKLMQCGQLTDFEASRILNISLEHVHFLFAQYLSRSKLKKEIM